MSDVTMPQLGETVTEGTITKWFKKIGETVERDELLFEVSTDKVDSEVTSPAAGVLTEIRVNEGDTVDVGSVLAIISDGAAAPAPPAPPEPVVAPPAPEPVPVPAAPVAAAPVAAPAPAAPSVVAPAPMGVAPAEVVQPSVLTPPAAASAEGFAKVLSPVVRKLINDNNLDPNSITGTGVGGRVTREDVIAVIEANGGSTPTPIAPAPVVPVAAAAAPVAPAPVAQAPIAPSPAPVAAPPVVAPPVSATPAPVPAPAAAPAVVRSSRDDVIPFSNIRRRTGEHMVMSLSTAPHAFIAAEIDFSNVDRVRNKRKETWKAEEGFSLTYLPFIARAVVEAMVQYPNVNASVSGDSLVVHRGVNLGIAVDLDFQGLLVPVVRDADGKRMRAIARDIADVAGRARTKKLVADDLVGGTFTISNAGPYGIDLMSSIINQPQVAILSTTAVKKRPVVVELPDGGDTIAIHPTGWIGFSWDHRAFDGAYAASFLAKVKELLETRDWNSEL
jgi:pyruvate dehydrogenase E2 component (dihydrolipoamide acetyltransferase)